MRPVKWRFVAQEPPSTCVQSCVRVSPSDGVGTKALSACTYTGLERGHEELKDFGLSFAYGTRVCIAKRW